MRVGSFNGHNGTVWTCDITCELQLLSTFHLQVQHLLRSMQQLALRGLLTSAVCLLTVSCAPPAGDSAKLITGSADSSARLWDIQNGKCLHTFKFNEPCRSVKLAVGDGMAAISSDPFMGVPACIYLVSRVWFSWRVRCRSTSVVPSCWTFPEHGAAQPEAALSACCIRGCNSRFLCAELRLPCMPQVTIAEDPADQDTTILQSLKGPTGRIQRVEWTDLNRTLISAGEDGIVRRWDVEVRLQPAMPCVVKLDHHHVFVGLGGHSRCFVGWCWGAPAATKSAQACSCMAGYARRTLSS